MVKRRRADPLRAEEASQRSPLAAGRHPTSSIRASICQRPLMRRCGRSPSTKDAKSMTCSWRASTAFWIKFVVHACGGLSLPRSHAQ
jgi:hypothetical protein